MVRYFSFYMLLLSQIIILPYAQAQAAEDNYPKIGDHCPNFILKDLQYTSRKKAALSDFKGKPFILDFFSEGCTACFMSFPEIDTLSKEFHGKINFILIAKNSSGVKKQYEKYMKHYGLSLPVNYDDSVLWIQFGVFHVPYTLWVDSSGIIRQITVSFAMNTARLNNFIRGIDQPLVTMDNYGIVKNEMAGKGFYNLKRPFLIGGNGGSDTSFQYRSILCRWDPRSGFVSDFYISSKNHNELNEIGVPLADLYKLAYGDTVATSQPTVPDDVERHIANHYGEWANDVVLELKNREIFKFDFDSLKNVFSYSLHVPDSVASPVKLQQIMQRDLKNYFSFNVSIEKRIMPCWKLIKRSNYSSNLRTKGGTPMITANFNSYVMVNEPSKYLNSMFYMHQNDWLFIDETGIDYNMDINMQCIFNDLDDIRRELNKNGLDLVKGEKEMNVIVIRD